MEEGREGGREEGGKEGMEGGKREGGREEGGREGEGEGCDTTTIHHMYSPYAVIGSTCTCTGLYMYMMRHNKQSKATQHHHLRWLSFKENVSCPRWDSNPHHCLSALSTNY